MKSSQVLREAARLVELRVCDDGCSAICAVPGRRRKVIGPDLFREGNFRYFWDSAAQKRLWVLFYPDAQKPYFWDNDRDARVVGLCLAAAIAESEGQ